MTRSTSRYRFHHRAYETTASPEAVRNLVGDEYFNMEIRDMNRSHRYERLLYFMIRNQSIDEMSTFFGIKKMTLRSWVLNSHFTKTPEFAIWAMGQDDASDSNLGRSSNYTNLIGFSTPELHTMPRINMAPDWNDDLYELLNEHALDNLLDLYMRQRNAVEEYRENLANAQEFIAEFNDEHGTNHDASHWIKWEKENLNPSDICCDIRSERGVMIALNCSLIRALAYRQIYNDLRTQLEAQLNSEVSETPSVSHEGRNHINRRNGIGVSD